MNQRRFFYLAPCAVLLGMVWGCGGGGDVQETAQTTTVDGTLTIDGKPYGPALLSFTHSSKESAPGLEANVKEDGSFDLLSYKADGNPPEGTYNVAIDEDPEAMSAAGIPNVDSLTVEIKITEGETLKLKIEATATGGELRTGGPEP